MEVTSASCLAVTGRNKQSINSEEMINSLYLFGISNFENGIFETK